MHRSLWQELAKLLAIAKRQLVLCNLPISDTRNPIKKTYLVALHDKTGNGIRYRKE